MLKPNETMEIWCDEAGSTGPALLDLSQRYFAYSSIAISAYEAAELVKDVRSRFPVQMPELKASRLLKTARGRQLICELLGLLSDRYAVVVHDKVLALCAQFYEYTFEPVFRDSPWLLYEKQLNLHVAMFLYLWFRGHEQDAQEALAQFEAYMRTLDAARAPLLFGEVQITGPLTGEPLQSIIRFTRAMRQEIVSDNATLANELPAEGRWVLDLATTSVWSHLNYWGAKGSSLAVTCDESKPILANIPKLTGDDSDPGIQRARMKNYQGHLGWHLAHPVKFASSMSHYGLQIADVVAGVAAYAIRQDIPSNEELIIYRKCLQERVLPACILPDFSQIDPQKKGAAVSAAMLYRLADRAERGESMHGNLESDYMLAEQAWDSGAFRMG